MFQFILFAPGDKFCCFVHVVVVVLVERLLFLEEEGWEEARFCVVFFS